MKNSESSLLFSRISIQAVPVKVPLPCNIYLSVPSKSTPILFRKQGDILTPKRLKTLFQFRVKHMYIERAERKSFQDYLWNLAQDESVPISIRGPAMRDALTLQLESLHTDTEIQENIEKAAQLIQSLSRYGSAPLQTVKQLVPFLCHDEYEYNHGVNVAVYSMILAQHVLTESPRRIWEIGFGGLIHDIGKRSSSDAPIHNNGSTHESTTLREHPIIAIQLLEGIEAVPQSTREIISLHHECFNGSGYPYGLKGTDIPKNAYLVGVCDVYDELTSTCSHRKAHAREEAIALMRMMQPFRFEASVFNAFMENFQGA